MIGDVLAVALNEKTRKYFQLIARDPLQLNSDVIRAFKEEYSVDEPPEMSEIVAGEVQFYAHCITNWGVKLGFWEKVGKSPNVGNVDHILFCLTSEYGRAAGEEPIVTSDRWYVWRVFDDDYTHVGKLKGINRTAEFGVVFTPDDIAHRIITGEHKYSIPSYD